ncbi:ABC transporter permease [Vallitalea longa]|uniref:ABC transporter permease n=1 Tax=Vallitalea longa TaxID=2936439 RepID=A0A9W6DDS8_9FIRM|nr:energy-coupling factor transporter transmembrane component T [Vallitalea longa]GKX27618.1 ABC transporter permease [Vallitalea longa]
MNLMFITSSKKQGLIHIDPRTKLYILLVGNLSVFFAGSIKLEVILACFIIIFGLITGAYRFTFKMSVAYFIILLIQSLSSIYLVKTLKIMLVSFCMFIRKIFPCGMLGGIIISTTKVNEFMAAMNRIHMPRSVVIPLTVMLRYFPMVGEDFGCIKDAMKMRNVSPSIKGFLVTPLQTIECVYVPLMMSASKVADELSAAAVTRGIENPKLRTCVQKIHFTIADVMCTICFTALLVLAIVL